MNELQLLAQHITQQFPSAKVDIDEPSGQATAGWRDIIYRNKWIVVEWKPNRGFEVSDCTGEGPFGTSRDATYDNAEDTFQAVLSLL